MVRIIFLKRSLLVIFLASSSITPLLALPSQSAVLIKNKRQTSYIFENIKNLLCEKGLDETVAVQKLDKLFTDKAEISAKLSQLYKSPHLDISQRELEDTLVKYALYEKSLDLSSYSSMIGFIQNITKKPLNNKQLEYINNFTSIV